MIPLRHEKLLEDIILCEALPKANSALRPLQYIDGHFFIDFYHDFDSYPENYF